MDLERMGKVIEVAEKEGLDELELRMEMFICVGGEKARVFSLQTQPELFPALIKGYNSKMDDFAKLRGELQKILDEDKKA